MEYERPDVDMEEISNKAIDMKSNLSYYENLTNLLKPYPPAVRIALIEEMDCRGKFPGMTWLE